MTGSPHKVTHIEEVVPFLDLTPQDNQVWQTDHSFFHFLLITHRCYFLFFSFIVIILFILQLYCCVASSFVSLSISCFLADNRHISFCCCYIILACRNSFCNSPLYHGHGTKVLAKEL